ncbi:hypothetical protein LTS08_008703 [Lithohypha guttulata]|nr:hypothetical protein LTS08_008703 [Lithohypha guttulata]
MALPKSLTLTPKQREFVSNAEEGSILRFAGREYRKTEGRLIPIPESAPNVSHVPRAETSIPRHTNVSGTSAPGHSDHYEYKSTTHGANVPPLPHLNTENFPGAGAAYGTSSNALHLPAAAESSHGLPIVRNKPVNIPPQSGTSREEPRGSGPYGTSSSSLRAPHAHDTYSGSGTPLSPIPNHSFEVAGSIESGPSGSLSKVTLSGSHRTTSTSGDQRSNRAVFTTLHGGSKSFASIQQNNFGARAQYLGQNPDLVRAKLDEFYKEAVQQIRAGNHAAAAQCMQSLVILRLCERIQPDSLEPYVLRMTKEGTEENGRYRDTYDNICKAAEKQAREKDKKGSQHEGRQAASNTGSGTKQQKHAHSKHDRHDSKFEPPHGPKLSIASLTVTDHGSTQMPDTSDPLEKISLLEIVPVRTEKELKKVKPEQFENKEMRKLSARYQLKHGRTFFTSGTVFALLWHESAGESRHGSARSRPKESGERSNADVTDRLPPDMTISAYGTKIFSHIRRMVVIRNRDGYCWCIPINSYGGRGLSKDGLTAEQREAHAIIHDSTKKPTPVDGEVEIFKEPIAVDTVPGESLTAASRLHYGKLYVVEWNVPVMHVGQVTEECMPTLLADAALELLGGGSAP